VRSLSGVYIEPWVVVNEWQPGPDECWKIHNYSGKSSGLVDALETHLADGGRPFVVCSAQKAKSRWGTTQKVTLQNCFLTSGYCALTLSQLLTLPTELIGALSISTKFYRITTLCWHPSIETGVSIDLRDTLPRCGRFSRITA